MQKRLTEAQRDALREFANIGAGHAAATLSTWLGGERIAFEPPEAEQLSSTALAQRLGGELAPRLHCVLAVQGAVVGALWLVLAQPEAQRLGAWFSGEATPTEASVDEALRCLAVQVGASALPAMGRLTGLVLEAAGAEVRRAGAGELARAACAEESQVVLAARLQAPSGAVHFLFLPQPSALGALLRALRV